MVIALGLDLSLTGSGVAIIRDPRAVEFSDEPAFQVCTLGAKGTNADSLDTRLARIEKLADQIETVWRGAMEWPDIAMIETPAYEQTNGKSHDRSGLWWFVVRSLSNAGIQIVEVATTKVKTYGTGKGTMRKDAVMAAAIKRYPDADIADNNQSDAIILAAMGMRRLGAAVEDALPISHVRAMSGLVPLGEEPGF